MKIREDLVLRKVGDTWAVFPIGEALNDFGNIMKLNETGAFMWRKLEQGCSEQELITAISKEYNVEQHKAEQVLCKFIKLLEKDEILRLQ